MRAPITKLDSFGVPHCTGARCPHHSKKQRCAITGDAVESVCQPAVREMVGQLTTIGAVVNRYWNNDRDARRTKATRLDAAEFALTSISNAFPEPF